MKQIELTKSEFQCLFDSKEYNPPVNSESEEFEREFDNVMNLVRSLLKASFKDSEFYIHPHHGGQRSLDVPFDIDGYDNPELVRSVQKALSDDDLDWMVCFWFTSFLFITVDSVRRFDPRMNPRANQ